MSPEERVKRTWLMSAVLCLVVVAGCGDSNGDVEPPGVGGSGGASNTPIEVTADSFDCILDGERVRKFFIKNLTGDVAASVAVANGEADLPYPPGTLLQLVPQEAMVKREEGFSSETQDWEFFFLEVDAEGTTIATRGAAEAENSFGLNCFECHSAAPDNDFVCETGNGCDPLTLSDMLIEAAQQGDPRCL
ncbi:MAG: hypothetical protein AAF436_04370 [Myxococcota bacterium]